MRRPFTTKQAISNGITEDALKWGVKTGRFQRLLQGVYLDGTEPPTAIEQALALVIATDGVASGTLAGRLHRLDSVGLQKRFVTIPADSKSERPAIRRLDLPADAITSVDGYKCTTGLQTMLDLAPMLDDLRWEQALESALRKKLTTIQEIETALTTRRRGNKRMRRVLKLRPPNAPPTGSVLETMAVQLMRTDPALPIPTRQLAVRNKYDEFCGFVDLSFPEHGVFLELDGGHHKDQPQYDASRQTRVTAATGWLVGRFTWDDITKRPNTTRREIAELLALA